MAIRAALGAGPSEVDPAVGGRKRTFWQVQAESAGLVLARLGPAHDGQSGAQVQPR